MLDLLILAGLGLVAAALIPLARLYTLIDH